MLKISYASYSGLFLVILAQFSVEMCVAAENSPKTLKPHIVRLQSHLRSSMLILLKSSSPVLLMISNDLRLMTLDDLETAQYEVLVVFFGFSVATQRLRLSVIVFTLNAPIVVK